jgi:ribosome-associated protein
LTPVNESRLFSIHLSGAKWGELIKLLVDTTIKEEALLAAKIALSKKAQDIVLLELSHIVDFTDYFLVCSGTSTTQVRAIADAIEEKFKEKGVLPSHIEGYSESRWVLMDYDDMIIHIFHEETRKFYELERLWGDALRIPIETD